MVVTEEKNYSNTEQLEYFTLILTRFFSFHLYQPRKNVLDMHIRMGFAISPNFLLSFFGKSHEKKKFPEIFGAVTVKTGFICK